MDAAMSGPAPRRSGFTCPRRISSGFYECNILEIQGVHLLPPLGCSPVQAQASIMDSS